MAAAVDLFAAMASQWNTGAAGVIGLRYESLPVLMDAHGIPQFARRDLIADLQIMEYAATEVINGR